MEKYTNLKFSNEQIQRVKFEETNDQKTTILKIKNSKI